MLSQAPSTETPYLDDEHGSNAPFAVLFDSDGVIVDTEGISLISFRQATREFIGCDLSEEEIESACGLRDVDIVSRLARAYDVKIDLEAYRQRKTDLYHEQAEKHPVRVFPGVVELLELLRHERIPFALASSGPRAKIEFNLRSARIRKLFTVIVSGEEVERGKPEPDVFLEAARRIGMEPLRCVVVEDSINGIRAARVGRMASLAVSNTFNPYQLRQADRIVETLERIKVADLHQLVLNNVQSGGAGVPASGAPGAANPNEEIPIPEAQRRKLGVSSLS